VADRPRAVLDANVFVSGILSPKGTPARLLRALRDGDFDLVTSQVINEEILSVLERPRIRDRYRLRGEVFDVAAILFGAAAVLADPKPVRGSPDPDDDKYLAAAVDGRADYLVTGDKAGLLGIAEFEGIPIVSPREFLRILRRR
jgi:hypothetical protein